MGAKRKLVSYRSLDNWRNTRGGLVTLDRHVVGRNLFYLSYGSRDTTHYTIVLAERN
jgi:hypothetical protein